MEQPTHHRPRRRQRHLPGLFWPLLLITAGVLLLLWELGQLPAGAWAVLWRLWPVALVALGIDLLIGRRSVIGSVVSGLLIAALFAAAILLALNAQRVPALARFTEPPAIQHDQVEHPLGDLETATIIVDWPAQGGSLTALEDSTALLSADVAYRGELVFDVEQRGESARVRLDRQPAQDWPWLWLQSLSGEPLAPWQVALSGRIPLEIDLDGGSGHQDVDLSDLQVSRLTLDVGSGSVDLRLPAGQSIDVDIDGGSGALTIHLPDDAAVQIKLDSGSGTFDAGPNLTLMAGDADGDSTWETEDYGESSEQITISVDQGSGDLRFR